MEARPSVFVCTNCPHPPKGVERPVEEPCAGKDLFTALQHAVGQDVELGTTTVSPVRCQGGCDGPVSVSFRHGNKEVLMFINQSTNTVDDIVQTLKAYIAQPLNAKLMKKDRAPACRENLHARIPPVVG